jgi:hypothetical protein
MTDFDIVVGGLLAMGVLCTAYIVYDWVRNRHLPERQPLESTSADFDFLAVDGDRVEVRR